MTEPGLLSVAAADRALRATDELRRRSAAKLQPLGIVVNRVRPSSREQSFRIQELKDMFGPLVLNPPLSERTVLQQAQGSARPIHEWPGKPASELASSFDSILDRALRSENMRGRGSSRLNSVTAPAKPTEKPQTVAEKPQRPADAPKKTGKTEKNPAQAEEKPNPAQGDKAKKKSSEPTQASNHNANTAGFDAMLSRKVESMKEAKGHKPKH